ncbi:MAG: RagB/SusD family nutrient uptake outer membrane protein [Rikenellaceae bacterium]|jgi:hypothetical protein|nr:RagB/SusD family nutrient uptake outer membrane protein [Rikenellaceae bacterium]
MNRKIIFFFATVALLFSSCEDFLSSDSPSKFTQEYIYSRESEIYRAVCSVYALMTADAGYSIRLSMYYTVNSDVEYSGVNATPDAGRRDIFTGEATSSNSEVQNPWNNLYAAVNRANEAIEGIEGSAIYQASDPATPSNIRHMYGEVKTLRAFYYLELVKNWGDVPFMTKGATSGMDFYIPTTDRDEILSHMINDLIEVEPTMFYAAQLSEGVERVSREFTQALIARLALFRGGYALRPNLANPNDVGTMDRKSDYMDYYKIANKYAKQVIDEGKHELISDFRTVFLNECRSVVPVGDDVIYEWAFKPGAGGSSEVGYYLGVGISNNPATHEYGTASSAVQMTPTYFYSFDPQDPRQRVCVSLISYNEKLNEVPVSATGLKVGKWCKVWMAAPPGISSSKATGINFPSMRFADVLLMYAETENEINGAPTAAAREALKRVRRRAFRGLEPAVIAEKVDQYVDKLSSKEDFFNAVVDERAWELGGEMLRKHDLVRWNLMGRKFRQMRLDLIQMGKDAQSWDVASGIASSGKFSHLPDKLYYKMGDDGKTIDFLNVNRHVNANDVPTGYTTLNWLINLYPKNVNTGEYAAATFIGQCWRGCVGDDVNSTSPVPYILPIPQATIDAAGGVLENYYGKGPK